MCNVNGQLVHISRPAERYACSWHYGMWHSARESKGPAYDTSCKECSPAARGVETSPERRPCLRYLDGHESCANAVELPRPNTAGHHQVLRRRDGVRTPVPGPKMLQDYQQHMRGVDLLDQAISYHTVNHRSRGKSLLLCCWHIIPMLLQRIRLMRAIDSGGQPSSTSWRAWGVILSETQGQREPRQPERPLQTHTLERMFAKRRVCRECAFSMPAGERTQAKPYILGLYLLLFNTLWVHLYVIVIHDLLCI